MAQFSDETVVGREAWRLRARQIKEGLGSLADNVRGLAAQGLERTGEAAGALQSWLVEPKSLAQRVVDTQALLTATQQRLRVEGPRATARVLDQGRMAVAFARNQALQGTPRRRQSHAALNMATFEAQAELTLMLLDAGKRAAMVPLAEQLRDAQLSMLRKTADYRDCADCPRFSGAKGGSCCSEHVAQWFRPIDGIYRRLLDERAPLWPKLHAEESRCGFLGERGCVLPPGTRPITCVGFYCNDLRDHLIRDGRWTDLAPEFAAMRKALKGLDFKFALHRRKLTGSRDTIKDSSMGYLWAKLMNVYAAYDQITPAQATAGHNELAGS